MNQKRGGANVGYEEAEVKVLRGNTEDKDDIVYQYVRFCHIADEQRRLHGPTSAAVDATIRQCVDEGILAPILVSRQKEVSDIMVTLYDQEKVMEIHDYNILLEGEKIGHTKGRSEGLVEGREEGISGMVSALKKFTQDKNYVVQEIMQQFKLPLCEAEAKVEKYWSQP